MTLVEEMPTGPDQFPVAVLIRRQPSANRWVQYSWQVLGVVVNSQVDHNAAGVQVRSAEEGDEFLWGGLAVRLYKDEAESYYHNLMSPKPSLYVIARRNDDGCPEPFLVSASFDEANAYVESEEEAYAVAMPAEVYGSIERFVLKFYTPEPRKKRRRKNWKKGEQ